MAYTDYTPQDINHPTIPIPDDAEMQSSGVAAFTTALESIADNAAHFGELLVLGTTIEGDSYGAHATNLFNIPNDTAEHILEVSAVDVVYDVTPSLNGDVLHCEASFNAQTDSDTYVTTFRLKIAYGLGDELLDTAIVMGAGITRVHLQGILAATTDDTEPNVYVTAEVAHATVTASVYGPINITVTRKRP